MATTVHFNFSPIERHQPLALSRGTFRWIAVYTHEKSVATQDCRISEVPRKFVDDTHGGAMVVWSAVILSAWAAISASISLLTNIRQERRIRDVYNLIIIFSIFSPEISSEGWLMAISVACPQSRHYAIIQTGPNDTQSW